MIVFLGDVALIDSIKCKFKPEAPYVFNLEYVLGNTAGLKKQCNKINLSSGNQNFTELFGKNPIAVSIANNHSFDYGKDGYEMTIEQLNRNSIGVIGGQTYHMDNGTCILAYSMLEENRNTGDFYFDRARVLHDITEVRKKNKNGCLIVLIHWGIENDAVEDSNQIRAAHWLVDNGVDLVIGHHPHCIQHIEVYKGKHIFYSLGNTIFGNMNQQSHFDINNVSHRKYRIRWQRWNRKSLAVVFDDEKKIVNEIIPLYQDTKNVVDISSFDISKYYSERKSYFQKTIYTLRKYYLFFVSNFMVDGKLFDMQAVFSELKS